MEHIRLTGLIAATHTPFRTDGALQLATVEKQAEFLQSVDVSTVFIGGSTGESHSLTVSERLALAERWRDVTRNSKMRVVVHVGSNCLSDARQFAEQAERLEVAAISALAPSYFKPRSVDVLIDCAAMIAAAAPTRPFYFYDIPSMTGVHFSMPEFLEKAASRIPTLVGLKFTNSDLVAYQMCLQSQPGRWDIPFGYDEFLLAALALGAKGAVGSSYNFAAPIYHRVIRAFEANDFETARREQHRSVRLIQLLAGYGYMGAAKAVMDMLGVPVGPARLPNNTLNQIESERLEDELTKLGFFDWLVKT